MGDPQHRVSGCLPWLLVAGMAIVFLIVFAAFMASKTESVYMGAYVYFYEESRLQAARGDISHAAESLKSVVEYKSLKVPPNADLGRALSVVRQGAIREIIGRMRTLTGENLGDDPKPWLKKYYKEDAAESSHEGAPNGTRPLNSQTNSMSPASGPRR